MLARTQHVFQPVGVTGAACLSDTVHLKSGVIPMDSPLSHPIALRPKLENSYHPGPQISQGSQVSLHHTLKATGTHEWWGWWCHSAGGLSMLGLPGLSGPFPWGSVCP